MTTQIVEAEISRVHSVPPGTTPNYNKDNPIWKIVQVVEQVTLAAERDQYLEDRLEYVVPVDSIALHGPSGDQWQVHDPRNQDVKTDFQKQNVYDLRLADVQLVRGYAVTREGTVSFLHIAFSPSHESPLLEPGGVYPGPAIKLFLRIGESSTGSELLSVPYDAESHQYKLELWSSGNDLEHQLGPRGRDSITRGALLVRPDLIHGTLEDFQGQKFDQLRDGAKDRGQGFEMFDYLPQHTMHPVRPLDIELAWVDSTGQRWDSNGGKNYRYRFAMSFRGWRNYLGVGQSANPHGGIGILEYRNLYSNYFAYEAARRAALGSRWRPELGRELPSWSFDAQGKKPPKHEREEFLTVEYMDLHVLRPNCAIGIHRHRDNQEVFLMLEGRSLMVTGDWELHDERDRCIEIRTMLPGDMSLIKGGGMHALINNRDENVLLFMFGGYD